MKTIEFSKLALLLILLTAGGCTLFAPTPTVMRYPTARPSTVKITNTTLPRTQLFATTPPKTIKAAVSPVSTLPMLEAKNELMQLLARNNCEFPCLWGISPGFTKLNDVKNLSRYSIFSSKYVNFSTTGGLLFLRIPQTNDLLINVTLEIDIVNDVVNEIAFGTQFVKKTDDGYKLILGEKNYNDAIKGFSISNVLAKYGPPTNVNIYTWQTVPAGDPWDFHILLFYPQNGFSVDYVTDVNKVNGNIILGCPSSISFFSFWFWDPSKKVVTVQNVLKKYHLLNSKSIEAASALTVQEFYTLFREPENDECIETPRDTWPLP